MAQWYFRFGWNGNGGKPRIEIKFNANGILNWFMFLSFLTDLSMRLLSLSNVILFGLNINSFQYVTFVIIPWTGYKRKLAKIQKTSIPPVDEVSNQHTFVVCSYSARQTIFPWVIRVELLTPRKKYLALSVCNIS